MYASSIAVILLTLVALAGTLAVFGWAGWRGLLVARGGDDALALDDHDLRVARPWETAAQARARIEAHGPPLPPRPGEWGGA